MWKGSFGQRQVTGTVRRQSAHREFPCRKQPSNEENNMKIVVIGGTGLIGSKTVAILRQGGHEVVAGSPKSGINTITGEGLKEAMAGAQVAVDLANRSEEHTSELQSPYDLVCRLLLEKKKKKTKKKCTITKKQEK